MIECRNAFARRDADFARVDLHVLDVLIVDLVPILRQKDRAAVVKALDMRAGDRDVDAANHDVALRFRVDHGFVHALHRRLEVDDLAFAHAARRRLSHPQDLDRSIRSSLTDDDTDFRCPNFQSHHQVATCHAA